MHHARKLIFMNTTYWFRSFIFEPINCTHDQLDPSPKFPFTSLPPCNSLEGHEGRLLEIFGLLRYGALGCNLSNAFVQCEGINMVNGSFAMDLIDY